MDQPNDHHADAMLAKVRKLLAKTDPAAQSGTESILRVRLSAGFRGGVAAGTGAPDECAGPGSSAAGPVSRR